VLVNTGIEAFLRQIPAHAVGIRPRGVSRILLLFLCLFLPIFLGTVFSKLREGDASISLREDLMGFQIVIVSTQSRQFLTEVALIVLSCDLRMLLSLLKVALSDGV